MPVVQVGRRRASANKQRPPLVSFARPRRGGAPALRGGRGYKRVVPRGGREYAKYLIAFAPGLCPVVRERIVGYLIPGYAGRFLFEARPFNDQSSPVSITKRALKVKPGCSARQGRRGYRLVTPATLKAGAPPRRALPRQGRRGYGRSARSPGHPSKRGRSRAGEPTGGMQDERERPC
jgi:hypothetical protein